MSGRHQQPAGWIFPVGTQVVTLQPVLGEQGRILHPRGSVGVILKAPADILHAYRVRFADGLEKAIAAGELTPLAGHSQGEIGDGTAVSPDAGLFQQVIYRCIIGSRAYGLAEEESDIDRRGIYLPPASLHWSLHGVPEQIANHATQEEYWEIQKFLVLALKAKPNILECLYTPLVEAATPLAEELRRMRKIFLSRLIYQSYSGYVMSQFKRIQARRRNQGQVKWKQAMHLIRLLLAGVEALRSETIPIEVGPHRDELLAIKRGELTWEQVESRRLALHAEFEQAFAQTKLPERPDYAAANAFLLQARRSAVEPERRG